MMLNTIGLTQEEIKFMVGGLKEFGEPVAVVYFSGSKLSTTGANELADRLIKFAESNKLTINEPHIREDGKQFKDRIQLNRIIKKLENKDNVPFDVLVVKSLTDVARTAYDIKHLIEIFEANGKTLMTLDDVFISSKMMPGAKGMLDTLVMFESRSRSELVSIAHVKAVKDGVQLGRRCKELDMVKVKQLRDSGLGWQKICNEIGNPVSFVQLRLRFIKEFGHK
jgi:DNA invertase Pin-like site-specific DNA recombinase